MNLHKIVSGAIGSVNHHEMVTLYRCKGTTNTGGIVSVAYEASDIMAQVQAPTAADLRLFDNFGNIVELGSRSIALGEENLTHLLGQVMTACYLFFGGGKTLASKQFASVLHRTQCNNLLANSAKSDLLLEV